MYMPHNTYLAAYDAVPANFCTPRNARLCGYYSIFTYFHIMSYHNKVIQLYALPDYCGAHCSTVYGSIGAHFHIVFNNYIAYLGYLFIGAITQWGKSESIAAYYCT